MDVSITTTAVATKPVRVRDCEGLPCELTTVPATGTSLPGTEVFKTLFKKFTILRVLPWIP